MTIKEIKKRWKETVDDSPVDYMIHVNIYEDDDGRMRVNISEDNSSGYDKVINNTDDICNALSDYLETQI